MSQSLATIVIDVKDNDTNPNMATLVSASLGTRGSTTVAFSGGKRQVTYLLQAASLRLGWEVTAKEAHIRTHLEDWKEKRRDRLDILKDIDLAAIGSFETFIGGSQSHLDTLMGALGTATAGGAIVSAPWVVPSAGMALLSLMAQIAQEAWGGTAIPTPSTFFTLQKEKIIQKYRGAKQEISARIALELSSLDLLTAQHRALLVPFTSDSFTYKIKDVLSQRVSTGMVNIDFGIRYEYDPLYQALFARKDQVEATYPVLPFMTLTVKEIYCGLLKEFGGSNILINSGPLPVVTNPLGGGGTVPGSRRWEARGFSSLAPGNVYQAICDELNAHRYQL